MHRKSRGMDPTTNTHCAAQKPHRYGGSGISLIMQQLSNQSQIQKAHSHTAAAGEQERLPEVFTSSLCERLLEKELMLKCHHFIKCFPQSTK